MKEILKIVITIIMAGIPIVISFLRSHYLYGELKRTELIFLSLERRFQIESAIILTIIINIAFVFGLLIYLGMGKLQSLIFTLISVCIFEAIGFWKSIMHPKKIHVIINKIDYILLHRIDEKHISARPALEKDDDSIVLLLMDQIAKHRIYIK